MIDSKCPVVNEENKNTSFLLLHIQPLSLTIPMQNAYQQFMSSAVQKFGVAEKKESMNGCVEDRRQAKPTAAPRDNCDFPASNIQLAPNLRISTQAGELSFDFVD